MDKIRKITIKDVEYVPLRDILGCIGVIGLSCVEAGDLNGAIVLDSLAQTFQRQEIYEDFPKTSDNKGEENVVRLFD